MPQDDSSNGTNDATGSPLGHGPAPSEYPQRMRIGELEVLVFGDVNAADPAAENVDIEVIKPDGSRWSATFFPLANVDALFAKNEVTGECARGTYLWAADMVLVKEVTVAVIARTIEDLHARDLFKVAFARLSD